MTHYLKAVEALKSDADGKAVVAKMKEMPTDDKLFGKGSVRIDGRKIHPMYLFQVKTPAESKGPSRIVHDQSAAGATKIQRASPRLIRADFFRPSSSQRPVRMPMSRSTIRHQGHPA